MLRKLSGEMNYLGSIFPPVSSCMHPQRTNKDPRATIALGSVLASMCRFALGARSLGGKNSSFGAKIAAEHVGDLLARRCALAELSSEIAVGVGRSDEVVGDPTRWISPAILLLIDARRADVLRHLVGPWHRRTSAPSP